MCAFDAFVSLPLRVDPPGRHFGHRAAVLRRHQDGSKSGLSCERGSERESVCVSEGGGGHGKPRKCTNVFEVVVKSSADDNDNNSGKALLNSQRM